MTLSARRPIDFLNLVFVLDVLLKSCDPEGIQLGAASVLFPSVNGYIIGDSITSAGRVGLYFWNNIFPPSFPEHQKNLLDSKEDRGAKMGEGKENVDPDISSIEFR